MENNEKVTGKEDGNERNTCFVRLIHSAFHYIASLICFCPWTFIIVSSLLTLVLSLKIPFTAMSNDISDFTPFGARSRQEQQIFTEFFSNRGFPKAVYAFITPKHESSLLDVKHLNETVQVLDKISNDFYLKTPNGSKNFVEFCSGFCLLNEPVRHFYNGMLVSSTYTNSSRGSHLDLGYPLTTVLGTRLYMDPYFFGVQVEVEDQQFRERKSVSSVLDLKSNQLLRQVPNNLRKLELIVLQFRAEIGRDIKDEDLKEYEKAIERYFHEDFKSEFINVYILSDSFITSEIVRAGLSLLPFLAIGFAIMSIFSSITFMLSAFFLQQMNFTKIVLAVMACVCPFMACGATLGGMFIFGFRFGSILAVTPFLILAIGVDDAYLMVNAYQHITAIRRKSPLKLNREEELKFRIRYMLVETGPSVSITTITNMLAFGIGATTPTAEIQLFSIGNALAVTTDFIFQITIYAALMVVLGKWELNREYESTSEKSIGGDKNHYNHPKTSSINKIIRKYCKILTNKVVSSIVMGLLAVYWYSSIMGALRIKAELRPERLFLQDSPMIKIFNLRKKFIIPNYEVCWILVENPPGIDSPSDRDQMHRLITAFEKLPQNNGRFSTKFWLRDYEVFLKQIGEAEGTMEEEELFLTENGNQTKALKSNSNELFEFLNWPEFSFWKAFVQFNRTEERESQLTRFVATTAFHDTSLNDWSNRAALLNQWRAVVDRFAHMNASIYLEDAKFLDLISTMIPISTQSALFTFLSMFVVALLFISNPPVLFVATFSILSTSVGVFGIMSWLGADLDPIFMSAVIMSIGFSVDIPSHIGYHFYQTGKHTNDVAERLERTVECVGFPIMQASVSTILCVLSLFFVDLHMSKIFAQCMLLVVSIGTIHGLLIMPVIFNLVHFVSSSRKLPITH